MSQKSITTRASVPALEAVGRLYGEGRFEEGLRAAELALVTDPHNVELTNYAGGCALMTGDVPKAEKLMMSAIKAEPASAKAHFGLAFLYQQTNRPNEAEASYRRVIALDPQSAEAQCNLANLYAELGRSREAEACFRRALEIKPTYAVALNDFGIFYMRENRRSEAEACLRHALALQPNYALATNNLGRLLADGRSFEEAEKLYRHALSLRPDFADVHFNYGNLLAKTNRYDLALQAFRRTIELKPDYSDAFGNLGNLLKDLGRLEEAERCYLKVLEIQPDFVDALSTLGSLTMKMKQFRRSEVFFLRALTLDSKHVKSQLNYAFLLLLEGRLEEGWPYYEARYRFDSKSNAPALYWPDLLFPQWQGEDLKGKRLLIWHEQGHGDMIQFIRYAALLKFVGVSRLTLVCKKPLHTLMRTVKQIDEIKNFEDDHSFESHDFWTFPLSLPLYFKTRIDSIPSQTPYLSAPPKSKQKWRHKLSDPTLKVGIVWKGSTIHIDDAERSIQQLETLWPLWTVPGVTFVSLQKHPSGGEPIRVPAEQPVIDLGAGIEDFADAAAIIEQLDLVICVDTAIAHLAGALGKSVWVLTRYVPDWRWMMDREDSPWYPSMKLFRQQSRGNWGLPIQHMRMSLLTVSERHWTNYVQQNPKSALGHFFMGHVLHLQSRRDEAENEYRTSAQLEPQNANVYGQLGNLLKETDRLQEAEDAYRKVLALVPQSFVAHNNLGILFKLQKRCVEAEQEYKTALAINPVYVDGLNNLGNLYMSLDRFPESESCYKRALFLKPDFIDLYQNFGLLYKEHKRYADAEACYRQALKVERDNPKTRFVLAILLLAQGRFEEGWRFFETPYRYDQKIDKPVAIAPFLPFTMWRGESLKDKSLLIWFEQGFGDVIQFARYVSILRKNGAGRITFMCKRPLKALFDTLADVDEVLVEGDALGVYDYWTFVLSIPLYVGTRFDTIPSKTGYLSVPSARRAKWLGKIPGTGKKVGLVWKGSTDHKRDVERSLSCLQELKPLWRATDVTFVSLQKGQGQDEAQEMSAGLPVIDLGPLIEDFADTAAIIEQLDLVICVDTAIAHLAGALGKPTWVLLQHTGDWRWFLDLESSPWYPQMKLFRQTVKGEWGDVILRVAQELITFAS